MAKNKLKFSAYLFSAIILTLGLSISFQSLLADFTPPSNNPPTCPAGSPGCDAPLSVGPSNQQKQGMLLLNTAGNTNGLIVQSGNVGIGTVSPVEKLDVDGYIKGLTDNLFSSHSWTIGTGSVGRFSQNGSTSENSRIWDIGPHGQRAIIWKAVGDTDSGPDGGWTSEYFSIDHTKTYRFTIWIKKSVTTDGRTYFGTGGSGASLLRLDESPNSNPYFWSGDLPQLDRWYLLVGYVHGSGDSSTTSYGGIYDGVTGKKVLNITDYKFSPSTTATRHRSYLYYSTSGTATQYWWEPRVELVTGQEPTIEAMLGLDKGATQNSIKYFGGNVGIGTDGPGQKLSIASTEPYIRLQHTETGANDQGDYYSGINFYTNDPDHPSLPGVHSYIRAMHTRAGTGHTYADAGLDFGTLNTSGSVTSRMVIDHAGNVGIGTASPGQKLDVSGNIRASGEIISTTYNAFRAVAPNYGIFLRNDNVNTYMLLTNNGDSYGTWNTLRPFRIENSTGNVYLGNNAFTVNHGGNVGIGTASPSAKLEINGTTKINGGDFEFWFNNTSDKTAAIDTAWRLRKNDGTGNFHKYINTAGGVSPVYETDGFAYHELYNPRNGIYRFQTATSGLAGNAISWLETLTLRDGNVGIGTTAPGYKLHVNGTVFASEYYGGACDIAERYNADDEEKGDLGPGDILSLSRSGDLKVGKSKQAYDTMVIGVFSTDPMLTMGEFEGSNNEDNPPVALLGRVPTKVTNENGAIEIGDLIVSSSKEGHGMKCDEYSKCQGAVVGKALENFNGEEGVIEVLINVGM